jgi:hypothetical protein
MENRIKKLPVPVLDLNTILMAKERLRAERKKAYLDGVYDGLCHILKKLTHDKILDNYSAEGHVFNNDPCIAEVLKVLNKESTENQEELT